jgi:hypothetical protein
MTTFGRGGFASPRGLGMISIRCAALAFAVALVVGMPGRAQAGAAQQMCAGAMAEAIAASMDAQNKQMAFFIARNNLTTARAYSDPSVSAFFASALASAAAARDAAVSAMATANAASDAACYDGIANSANCGVFLGLPVFPYSPISVTNPGGGVGDDYTGRTWAGADIDINRIMPGWPFGTAKVQANKCSGEPGAPGPDGAPITVSAPPPPASAVVLEPPSLDPKTGKQLPPKTTAPVIRPPIEVIPGPRAYNPPVDMTPPPRVYNPAATTTPPPTPAPGSIARLFDRWTDHPPAPTTLPTPRAPITAPIARAPGTAPTAPAPAVAPHAPGTVFHDPPGSFNPTAAPTRTPPHCTDCARSRPCAAPAGRRVS